MGNDPALPFISKPEKKKKSVREETPVFPGGVCEQAGSEMQSLGY